MGNTRWVIALTGASGMPYAMRLIELCVRQGVPLDLTISRAGAEVFQHERGVPLELESETSVLTAIVGDLAADVRYHHFSNIGASISSGSRPAAGMVIVPASMGTLGAVAAGNSSNLIQRVADVCLKERRPLICVPRETPLNLIHLRSLTALTEAGATILPASPGFYHHPNKVQDIVDFIVDRIVSHMGLPVRLVEPYGQPMPDHGHEVTGIP